MKVLIQGAGIAGLTLAAALEKKGVDYTIIDKTPQLKAVGAGITLGSNALLELSPLIDLAELQNLGQELEELQVSDLEGQILMTTPSRLGEEGPKVLAIHRHHLHETLLKKLSPARVKLGASISSFTKANQEYSVTLSDKSQISAELIIGADGLHSEIRKNLFPLSSPVYTGYICWRSVINLKASDPGIAIEYWGSGKRMGIVQINKNQVYLYATLNAEKEAFTSQSQFTKKEYLKNLYSEFPKPAKEAWASAWEKTQLIHNNLEELLNPVWGHEQVILIGDAAHAMTPNLGQGAAMGIEDATALANLVGNGVNPKDILEKLISQRDQRVQWMARKSRELGRLAQMEGAVKTWTRNKVLKMTPSFLIRENLRQITTNNIWS